MMNITFFNVWKIILLSWKEICHYQNMSLNSMVSIVWDYLNTSLSGAIVEENSHCIEIDWI